jgi:hypothetical protein
VNPLAPLPAPFSSTRESLRALCCYVVAPARWALTGQIQLEPHGDAIATPPLPDSTRLVVRGDRFGIEPGTSMRITTLAECAALVGVDLRADLPFVGTDLPAFEPARDLGVAAEATTALAAWYSFGAQLLADVRAAIGHVARVGDAHLWPEHFDLAVVVADREGRGVNVGVSPGDSFSDDPYLYVGPWDRAGLTGEIWNAPFGAVRTRAELTTAADPREDAAAFLTAALTAALAS